MKAGSLTNRDHKSMDDFLSRVFDGVKYGEVDKTTFVSCMAHVMAALDIDNPSEAIAWFNQKELEFFNEVSTGLKSVR